MHEELEELANYELSILNWIIDIIPIPDEICREYLYSGCFELMLRDKSPEYEEPHAEALLSFDRLCNAAPNISRECLRMLSCAYTAIYFFFDEGREKRTVRSGAMSLQAAASARGAAIALLPTKMGFLAAQAQAERTQMLSAAGTQGAKSRNKPFENVKIWALKEASGLRGDQKTISRKLAILLPAHLAGASKDPARLIYDALRAVKPI